MCFLIRGIFWNVWGFPKSMWNIEVGLGKFLILEKLRGIGLAFVGWGLFTSSRQKLHILAFFYREMHFKFVKLITSSMEVRFKSYGFSKSRCIFSSLSLIFPTHCPTGWRECSRALCSAVGACRRMSCPRVVCRRATLLQSTSSTAAPPRLSHTTMLCLPPTWASVSSTCQPLPGNYRLIYNSSPSLLNTHKRDSSSDTLAGFTFQVYQDYGQYCVQ